MPLPGWAPLSTPMSPREILHNLSSFLISWPLVQELVADSGPLENGDMEE